MLYDMVLCGSIVFVGTLLFCGYVWLLGKFPAGRRIRRLWGKKIAGDEWGK